MPPESERSPQFTFGALVVSKAIFEVVQGEPPEDGETRPARLAVGLQINAKIQMHAEAQRAIVTLDVTVMPDRKWQPYRLEVVISGVFGVENGTTEQLDQFCRLGVPPILFPYVRETVNRLTMDAPHGRVRMEPINIADMLNKAEWAVQQTTPTTDAISP